MNIRDLIKTSRIYLDGGMGTLLQSRGLAPGELPERWNMEHPEEIVRIHKMYFDAGSNVVNSNTFGANSLKFDDDELEKIIKSALENARQAAEKSENKGEKYVALDIGPTGRLLKPYGDFDFEEAVAVFAKTVRLGAKYGADLIFIETMNDSYETKAAVLAAKENSDLPIFASNAYGEDGKLMTGASPDAMVAMLEGLGVDALGVNCSLGPKQLEGVIDAILKYSSTPVILKPNAGLPASDGERTYYDVDAESFAECVAAMAKKGVGIIGGCCGTTPEYIKKTVEATKDIEFEPIPKKNFTVVSSYTHAVRIGEKPILIGERINPTGKKRFKTALMENDMAYILNEGMNQQDRGADILDVNVGLPGIDERAMLENAVCEIQAVIDLPLQIDTTLSTAMEAALRRYNGKAMVNSVTGKAESMEKIFPLVKKYGGVVVALTLDEDGIPKDAAGKIRIAEKILENAKKYGIDKKDIVFDTLCMAISADSSAAVNTLQALNYIRNKMGVNTVLGVSNISFGLPERETINANFFAFALENGLSAGIINPYSDGILKAYYTFMTIHNMDDNCSEYIKFITSLESAEKNETVKTKDETIDLKTAISRGLKEKAAESCEVLLKDHAPLDIVNNDIVPALDSVGKGFEEKKVYLPQLLMSAEAAKSAFDKIKDAIAASGAKSEKKCTFVIATVQGDIHDIGKNLVVLMLKNYGYRVFDMGKDVPAEAIVKKAMEEHAQVIGLSALMTTTMMRMKDVVEEAKRVGCTAKIIIGGACITESFAEEIGADGYSKDASACVKLVDSLC